MELTLKRKYLKDDYTIGHLFINDAYECDTIEDKVRDLNKEAKVYSKTAIPYGRYEVTLNVQSPKYSTRSSYLWCNGFLPRLLNVKHFDGILIHCGNTAEDSAGCILVGQNRVKGRLINSMETLKALYAKMKIASEKGEKIWITIE